MVLVDDPIDNFINPTDVPKGDKLTKFIQKQGTKMVLKSLEQLINNERYKIIDSGEISVHRYVMVPDIDNMIYRKQSHDKLTHYCKLPPKGNFRDSQKENFQCELRKVMNLGIFIKKVNIYAGMNDSLCNPSSLEYQIAHDLRNKTMIDWDEKLPFHHCIYDHHYEKFECDCVGGLDHWETLDFIKNNIESNKKLYHTIMNDCRYDPHFFIPWRNLNGDLIYEEEITRGNCIDAHVKIGTLRVESFNNIVGLNVEFMWLFIDNIHYCPISSPSQGPHICHKLMCDTYLRGGFIICALSGIALTDRNYEWSINTKEIQRGSIEESNNKNIRECRKAFLSKPKHMNTGVSKNDLNNLDSEISISVYSGLKTFESLKNFHEDTRDRATNRTQKDKEHRELLKSKIMSEGTEKAIKMAKSGHFSNYMEYKREAFINVKSILQFGDGPLRAKLIEMEKLLNIRRTLDGINGSEMKKITLEISDYKMSRGSILPSNYQCIEYKPAETSSSSSSALTLYHQNERIETMTDIESKTFTIQKYLIDKSDVEKNIDDTIHRLADASIRFWALIRTRTRLGKLYPNFFNFNIFVYAFLYLQRDGYVINTGFAGLGDTIVFFEKDLFLKGALPPKMDDLKRMRIVNNSKRGVRFVYDQIKNAIQETIVDEKRSFVDLHPYRNSQLDFSIDSKEFPPSLFISLQVKKVMK